MRETFRVDLSSPVPNRTGSTQFFVTLYKPTLGDVLECGEPTQAIYGREAFQESINWGAVKAYLRRLLVDVAPEVLETHATAPDALRLAQALVPFIVGGSANMNVPSASSPSASV